MPVVPLKCESFEFFEEPELELIAETQFLTVVEWQDVANVASVAVLVPSVFGDFDEFVAKLLVVAEYFEEVF